MGGATGRVGGAVDIAEVGIPVVGGAADKVGGACVKVGC